MLGSQNNTPDEINAVSCYEQAVQFNAFLLCLCLKVFDDIYGTAVVR